MFIALVEHLPIPAAPYHKTMRNSLSTNHNLPATKGFTLIELLLYISLASIILIITSLFLSTLLESRIKNQSIAEVEQQGAQVMHLITQTLRNAEAVNSPLPGANSSTLSIDVINAASDPTIFDLSTDAIRITEGAEAAISLTNNLVTASNLDFTNLSRSGTPGAVHITFTLTHVNPSGRNEFAFSRTFYGSASLRQP